MNHYYRVGIVLLAALAATSTAAAQGAGKAPWEEFANRLKTSHSVSALGPDLFGDNVGLANGALSFSMTDVDLAGNNALRVAVDRKYTVFNRKDYISDSPLADWELDVPSISGVFAPNWTVSSNSTPSVARCSTIALPTQPVRDYYARDFWHGNTLTLPGGGGELLLDSAALPAPATGENFIWTTSDLNRPGFCRHPEASF